MTERLLFKPKPVPDDASGRAFRWDDWTGFRDKLSRNQLAELEGMAVFYRTSLSAVAMDYGVSPDGWAAEQLSATTNPDENRGSE